MAMASMRVHFVKAMGSLPQVSSVHHPWSFRSRRKHGGGNGHIVKTTGGGGLEHQPELTSGPLPLHPHVTSHPLCHSKNFPNFYGKDEFV